MAQHDYVLDNATGAAFRVDLNAVLQAIVTQNSGSSAPSVTKPHMFWASTGDNKLKQRNALDTAWIDICELNTPLANSGANSNITSLTGLTTPLSQAQGGTGTNNIPVFSAYQSSAQTLASAAYTKITFDTEEYDTNSNFATSRFTCTVPGYYLFTAGITVGAARTEILPVLYKNGSAYRNFGEDTTASASVSGSMLIKLDATDYVELYTYFALGQVTTAGSRYTYFQGHLVKAT